MPVPSAAQLKQFEEFQAFMAMQEDAPPADDAVTTAVKANAPKPRTQVKRASGTAVKAASVARNFDAMLLDGGKLKTAAVGTEVPSEGVVFKVNATTHDGAPLSGGARVAAYVEGRPAKTFTRPVIAALAEDGILEALASAIETIDKRAQLGAYKPAKVAEKATS